MNVSVIAYKVSVAPHYKSRKVPLSLMWSAHISKGQIYLLRLTTKLYSVSVNKSKARLNIRNTEVENSSNNYYFLMIMPFELMKRTFHEK